MDSYVRAATLISTSPLPRATQSRTCRSTPSYVNINLRFGSLRGRFEMARISPERGPQTARNFSLLHGSPSDNAPPRRTRIDEGFNSDDLVDGLPSIDAASSWLAPSSPKHREQFGDTHRSSHRLDTQPDRDATPRVLGALAILAFS